MLRWVLLTYYNKPYIITQINLKMVQRVHDNHLNGNQNINTNNSHNVNATQHTPINTTLPLHNTPNHNNTINTHITHHTHHNHKMASGSNHKSIPPTDITLLTIGLVLLVSCTIAMIIKTKKDIKEVKLNHKEVQEKWQELKNKTPHVCEAASEPLLSKSTHEQKPLDIL